MFFHFPLLNFPSHFSHLSLHTICILIFYRVLYYYIIKLFYLFYIINIANDTPHPGPHSQSSSPLPASPLPLRRCSPTHQHTLSPYHIITSEHPPSLGHQVCTGLPESFPTEARQGSPLLHMCQGPPTIPCPLFGWWLSLWEGPGYPVSLPVESLSFFGSLNPSPSSCIWLPKLCLMVCLWVFASVSIDCWVELLWRPLC